MSRPAEGSPGSGAAGRVGIRRRFPLPSLLSSGLAVLAGMLLLVAGTVPASASTPVILGSGGDAAALSRSVGSTLPAHAYGQLSGSVPQGRMVNMAPGVSWRTVASAQPGSSTYANIARWASTLKARGKPTLMAFSHEPEASGSSGLGSNTDFINAFRRVRTVFRSLGVGNVEYVWQMTAYSFEVSSGDRRAAAKWYPGDSYVDTVAADAYNWYNCGPGSGRWEELSQILVKPLAFARAHGKQLALPEFASQSDSRRAQWIRNAHAFFVANRSSIRAVFWFQRIEPRHTECRWPITSSADIAAFAEMVHDRAYFTTS